MTAPRRAVHQNIKNLIEEFLADQEIRTADDRKRVYEAGIRFAEERLSSDPRCNAFLVALARRLELAPTYLPWVLGRHPIPEQAYLSLFWDEQGSQLVGNREGLRYLARLCETLADSVSDADHLHTERGYELAPTSENLSLVLETNEWFREHWNQAVPGGTSVDHASPSLPHRDIDESKVAGVLVTDHIPDVVGIISNRVFPVLAVLPYEQGDSVWRKGVDNGDPDRYRIFKLEAPDNRNFDIALHLDDDTVAYLTRDDLERTYRLLFQKH